MIRRRPVFIIAVTLLPAAFLLAIPALAQQQGINPPLPAPPQYWTPVPKPGPGAPPAGYNMEVLPQQLATPQPMPSAAPIPSAAPVPLMSAAPEPNYPQLTMPAPPPTAAPASAPYTSNQFTAPMLPPVFRGCWEGTVSYLDSNQRVPGAPKVGYWTPKTYRLCYKRVGNGPYQLTFGQTGVVPSEKIRDSGGRVNVVATDGRSWARMRAFLHFDEYYPNYSTSTFAVDEVTMLECSINGDSMSVRAQVSGRRQDQPWFNALWHTTFIKVPM